MSSFNVKAVILHGTAASVMAWGFTKLQQLPADKWIRQQKGGHSQYLTILGLGIAWLTMVFGFGADLLPAVTVFRRIKRTLFMIAMPIAVVVSSIYWGLLLFAPDMILQPVNVSINPDQISVPSSSDMAPNLWRIPLPVDLALHASPVISLVVDFFFFEVKYSRREAVSGGFAVCNIAGLVYGSWVEWLATYNGFFPYPFLTENTPAVRIGIYTVVSYVALFTFWALNALHA
ncbi:FAR-17a/AIG1-like protein [Amylocystis lapponica]|nr:FAR-17a/AIG1-like protein [Amylocystis lapponica]